MKNKRLIKNIVMIFLIGASIFLGYLTMNYAKNNITSSNSNMNMEMNMGDGDTKQMPSSNSEEESSNNQMANDKEDVPDKPDGDDGSTPPEKPDGDDDTTPPEKPDGEDNNSGNNTDTSEKTDDEDSNFDPNSSNSSIEMPNMDMNINIESAKITIIYYVIFGFLSLIIASLIMYLIMSNFNKKTFKETFINKDKYIITILSIVILTSVLTIISAYITNNYFLNNNQNINMNNSSNNSSISYSSSKEITEDTKITEGEYTSSNSDENAILVNGDIDVTLKNITVSKTGDSDGGDNTSFYGTNSGIIAKGGANLTIKDATINTDATGANGVFSYGGYATTNNSSNDGTTINISDSTITTTKDNSGGIMTTGGGIMNATNLTINTAGTSSAAIRSDRGGGTVTVNKGTYTTTGKGSPAIYSTADITVSNATLVSKTSEGIVIEGNNSVTLDNVTLTDTNSALNGQSTTYKNIFLYQSMSGDASDGNSTFTSTDSTITTNKGDTFYITNTTAIINLTNNKITNNDSDGNFLRAKSDSWGNSNSNGGDVTLNMTNQTVKGNIVIDNISTLTMSMKDKSSFEGSINSDNSAKSITLSLDKTSTLKLTSDCYITSFSNKDSSNSNIDFNGYKLYVNGTSIN